MAGIIIASVVGAIMIFILLREFFAWYYKINKIVGLLEQLVEQNRLLLKAHGAGQWECPECHASNDLESFKCSACGYRLK